jgi:hypothetical protein
LIVVPGPLPAAPRRSLQFAKNDSTATLPKQEKNNSADVQRRLYPLAAMYLAYSFALGAPPPTHV